MANCYGMVGSRVVLAIALAGCSRSDKPIGGCTYRRVEGTCDLRNVEVEAHTEGKIQLRATYAWHGPLPAAGVAAERKHEWILSTIEETTFRDKLAATPSIGCQYEIDGGPCPPTLVFNEAELPNP